jgi:hypothetical protein
MKLLSSSYLPVTLMTEVTQLLFLLQDKFKRSTEKQSTEEVRNVSKIVVGKSCGKRQVERNLGIKPGSKAGTGLAEEQ